MADFTARQIIGKWKQGFALDIHLTNSEFLGYDTAGHARFDNTHSEMGELLLRLKYRNDASVVTEIVAGLETFIHTWKPPVQAIVPVPPTKNRFVQPVVTVATELSKKLGIPLANCVTRSRETPEMKNMDYQARQNHLTGLHKVDTTAVQGKTVLLFDDIYQSGATMSAISSVLYSSGNAADVYALTITKAGKG